jgi:hypothetical protein
LADELLVSACGWLVVDHLRSVWFSGTYFEDLIVFAEREELYFLDGELVEIDGKLSHDCLLTVLDLCKFDDDLARVLLT